MDISMTENPYEINCIGLKCPLPVLRLEKAIRDGYQHIILRADDPISVIDIPLAIKRANATLISQNKDKSIYKFEISLTSL